MRMKRSWRILWAPIVLVLAVGCGRPLSPTVRTVAQAESDSLPCLPARPYAPNCNFEVLADTLWLHLLPFRDSLALTLGDEVVVAELALHPDDSAGQVWVKVARDQSAIGWIEEGQLLRNTVPVDPISRCIHWFSHSHALSFFLVLAVFLLWFALRSSRRRQVRLIDFPHIDRLFPLTLSWLLASSATLYNSLQHFAPDLWERYYYAPTLNPFEVPFALGLFILCLGLIAVFGMALLDDLFHQATMEQAVFYLLGMASYCIFLYVFFTYVWVYAAYVCLLAYTLWCFHRLRRSHGYRYACGVCGAKLRNKGVCPHCGALNE